MSNFQSQNLTNNRNGSRYQNRPNKQFFEEEDENSHDDLKNHVKNRDDHEIGEGSVLQTKHCKKKKNKEIV